MCTVVLHSFFVKAVFSLRILINLTSLFDMSVKDQWQMMISLHLDDTALSSLTLSQAHARAALTCGIVLAGIFNQLNMLWFAACTVTENRGGTGS